MTTYYRPIAQTGSKRPDNAASIAGGWAWFTHAERLIRGEIPSLVSIKDVPDDVLRNISRPRAPMAGLDFGNPTLMGILNVTPDSFSDGGQFDTAEIASRHAIKMIENGADIIDIGGESTRPGAAHVDIEEEIRRTQPVIKAIRGQSQVPLSIDTRKADVAKAALDAGATLINDVAAMTFDPKIGAVASAQNTPICLMHAQGDPETMQQAPQYDDVLLDVYDVLQERIEYAEARGVRRDQIIVDPGIGFGKTLEHNLKLLNGLGLFHGLGVPILLGASRKSFIAKLTDAPDPAERLPGTLSTTLYGIAQGVQIHRVHDIKSVKQALIVSQAIDMGHP
ncbi:dihydropteroate synthase [Pseudaestuariivita rosea]|uniref:dihydropteroate synthase n=1 Tax=Pseudaestuariivita rosea TaxID=2763263 RepID=UPI001ABB76D3|nr:dihydropteroate synthase [Pseudaestuariivita rosea]